VTQQLCLFEQKHYLKLQKYELSELAWSKKKTHYQARHVVYLINRFNEFSRWIVYEVLRGPNQEIRARIVEKFIRICQKCLEERNYNAVMQIDMALQKQEVYHLKKTWNCVGSYEKDLLKSIREFTNPAKNFKNIREAMEQVQGLPAVPFLGLYLSDLVFNSELSDNIQSHPEMINIMKFRNKGTIIRRAMRFGELGHYTFESDMRFQVKLDLLPFCTDNGLQKISKDLE